MYLDHSRHVRTNHNEFGRKTDGVNKGYTGAGYWPVVPPKSRVLRTLALLFALALLTRVFIMIRHCTQTIYRLPFKTEGSQLSIDQDHQHSQHSIPPQKHTGDTLIIARHEFCKDRYTRHW
jgi:hypothetical protein